MAVNWKTSSLFLALFFAVAAVCANGSIPGAPVDADIGDDGVKDALKFAVTEFNKANNDVHLYRVSKVVRVQTQVVAGIKYIMTVKMGRTSCRKGKTGNIELCAFHNGPQLAKTSTCTFEVWSRPWIPETRLLKSTCT
ncbi:cystatin-like [Polyodon spathula]|uniref:cystatin-like n=1 Tax=Polyodon spathula TaxID=7913 RepID=UPI001B7EC166|nr:cystatin-like [Polyodon spathula]